MEYQFDLPRSQAQGATQDFDEQAQAIRRGEGADEFMLDLENQFATGPDYREMLLNASAPDATW